MSAQIHTNRKTKILINRYVRFDWINRYLWYWLPFIKSSLKAMISSNKSIASDKCVVVIRKNKPIIGMWVPIKTCKVRKQHHHLKGLLSTYYVYSHSNPQQRKIVCVSRALFMRHFNLSIMYFLQKVTPQRFSLNGGLQNLEKPTVLVLIGSDD